MLVSSLQHQATAKVAVLVLMDPEFAELEIKHQLPLYLLPDYKWEHLVKERLPPSTYPIGLQREIIAAIRPINYEIREWMTDHRKIFKYKEKHPFTFCWKSDGTINRLETACHLIRNRHFDLETRFGLACQYWCWSDIFSFWKLIPDSEKISLRDKYTKKYPKTTFEKNTFTWFLLHKKASDSRFPDWSKFSKVLIWSDLSIFNPTFNELPPSHRRSILTKALVISSNIPVVRFCFSLLDPEEQMHVLLQYPYQVLRIYLFWPLQSLFPNATIKVMNTLTENSFLCLLHILICQKILPGWRDANYVDLLRKFWRESPKSYKEYVKEHSIFDILTTILDGKIFHSPLRSGVYQKYLVHGKTVFQNAQLCVSMSDTHNIE